MNISPKSSKTKITFLYAAMIALGFILGNVIFNFLTPREKSLTEETKTLSTSLTKEDSKLVNSKLSTNTFSKESIQQISPDTSGQKPLLKDTLSLSSDAETEPLTSFILNGLFFSAEDAYALINNQIVKEGESVDGATVKRIDEDGVELEFNGAKVELPYRIK